MDLGHEVLVKSLNIFAVLMLVGLVSRVNIRGSSNFYDSCVTNQAECGFSSGNPISEIFGVVTFLMLLTLFEFEFLLLILSVGVEDYAFIGVFLVLIFSAADIFTLG